MGFVQKIITNKMTDYKLETLEVKARIAKIHLKDHGECYCSICELYKKDLERLKEYKKLKDEKEKIEEKMGSL